MINALVNNEYCVINVTWGMLRWKRFHHVYTDATILSPSCQLQILVSKIAHCTQLWQYTPTHASIHLNFVPLHKHHVSYSRTSDSISSILLLRTERSWSIRPIICCKTKQSQALKYHTNSHAPYLKHRSGHPVSVDLCVYVFALWCSVQMCSSPASSFPLCAALLQPDH